MAEKASGRLKLAGNMKANACPLLQIANHAEEIFSLGVAPRAKHADQAFGRRACRCTELLETDGRLDVIAQDRLAGFHIAAEHRINALAQKRLSKYLVVLDVLLHKISERF